MSFTIKTEQRNNITTLDFNVIRGHGTFITNIYRKPTFNDVNNHFDSFLPNTYKVGLIYTVVNRCLEICSRLSMFHTQLKLLREVF